MNKHIRTAVALAATVFATQALAQVTFYENEGFSGRSFTTSAPVGSLETFGFRDRAGSAVVKGTRWEVCDEDRYGGRCMVLRPGRYPSLGAMGLNDKIASTRALRANARVVDSRYAPLPAAAPVAAAAKATFYAEEGFGGRGIATTGTVEHFRRSPLESRASSVIVVGQRFEVCDEPRFEGRCVVLRPGRYHSPASMDLGNRIASSRVLNPAANIEDSRYAPMPGAVAAAAPVAPAVQPSSPPDYRRRNEERIFQVPISSVRAVVGPPEQRCWVERSEIPAERAKASVPGAVIGAVIGGILGHQVGGGTGKDIATAGGAIAGGVAGAKIGGGTSGTVAQDVRRCENVTNPTPAYYDVFYTFRGIEHRVQMAQPPGPTINVNERGEPRA